METTNKNFPLKTQTDKIIGLGIEVHKQLGPGFLEIVYKDALQYELLNNEIPFSRERQYRIKYKDIFLPRLFNADFVVFDEMSSGIVEVKAKENIANIDMAQTINYLKCSGCKVGLILNFGKTKLDIKRLVF